MMKKTLDIVIPVYNESECISETIRRLDATTQELQKKYSTRILFVDDGSSDDTFSQLEKRLKGDFKYKIIRLTRNFGHQMAITAGLDFADAQYIAIMDADLQDPPELLPDMLLKLEEGNHVVYGQRITREGESFVKLICFSLFYKIFSYLSEIQIPPNTGDFRVITKEVLMSLKSMRERHRFIRGLIPYTGWKSAAFYYERKERYSGESKYTYRKLFRLASDGLLSFSTRPIKLMRSFGLLTLITSFLILLYMLYLNLIHQDPVPGVALIVTVVIFFGSLQILFMALLGEYIGKTFEEVKSRPLYFVQEIINEGEGPEGQTA
jgi:glycosyltransferase involved in cell wall biosynthesis